MNKKVKQAIVDLCLRESSTDPLYYDEVRYSLDFVDWSKLKVDASDFDFVYRFKSGGHYFMVHNFENGIMFGGKRAIKLYESIETFTAEVFCSDESFEIWLTADMRIEFVGCFRMVVDGHDGEYAVEYRYPSRGKFHGEFDIDFFLKNLSSCFGIHAKA